MYETDLRSWLKHFDFIMWDMLSLTVSFWTAFFIRNNMVSGLAWESNYRGFYLLVITIYMILAFFFRIYSNIIRRSVWDEMFAVIKQNFLLFGCILAYLVFTKQSIIYSRLFLGYFSIINIFLMYIIRISWKNVVRRKLKESDKLAHVLVVTNSKLVDNCIKNMSSREYQSFQVTGIILTDGKCTNSSIDGIPVVADSDDMMEYIRLNVVDQVLFHIEEFPEQWNNIFRQLIEMGVVVHVNMAQFDKFPKKSISQIGSLSVITTSFQTASMQQVFLKRAMDIVGSIIGLVITGIAFVFVAPIIYLKSPGPILFSQERIGKNGRKFKIYKFRSMYLDAEKRKKELMSQNQMQGLMFKIDDDPRIIKGIGHFIRSTSIDELPQFWNILKGDMSLVGTRPPTVEEFEQYNYHHKIRLSFCPGLTGMWQVSGRSDITDFEDVVRLDEAYIANWNIWLDIKIILKTVQVVLQRKGSK